MDAVDFFKTIKDKEGDRKDGTLLNYAAKIIKKYFSYCISKSVLGDIIYDTQILHRDKQTAIREAADGILCRMQFFNEKTDLYSLIKKGRNHIVVKELIEAISMYDCDILIFPVYKAGNWAAHCMGESDTTIKKPRIVIPGDGISVTIQDLGTFIEEHI